MLVANFDTKHGGEWAPSRRNLGSLFVCPEQKAARHVDDRGVIVQLDVLFGKVAAFPQRAQPHDLPFGASGLTRAI
jgi:hypothetical protein